ncbi:helix-turn-helix domain-containing protein [Rothia kristinae]|uniref:helix-turn-helix domain-containing protein n=1 Tax=Rothia kristinae TaxID=37923 RepID=UPI0022E84E84|nr:helix-turn-helix transcriptional regulator [Rothia kristinae]MDN5639229.1 helix-turn-helix domain-containing protein [Actinomycetes bacterium]
MRTAQEVADNVRAALARRRMSQEAAAAGIGMSRAALNNRLNGKTAFDVAELERLSEVLDVPYSQLVEVTPR